MELFSEIYSRYYDIVGLILGKPELTQKDLQKIIDTYGFRETSIYLLPKISEWCFIRHENGRYYSKLRKVPRRPLTLLERRWLKAVISDKKIGLFLDKSDISRLNEFLKDESPLFCDKDFYFFDRSKDTQDFGDETYIRNFRIILKAVKERTDIFLTLNNNKSYKVFPMFIEYNAEKDAFSLCGNSGNRKYRYAISDISEVRLKDRQNNIIKPSEQEKKFVILKVFYQRNGIERFMTTFATYEKSTEPMPYGCRAIVKYDESDETEILEKILSFGVIIEVEAPFEIRKIIKNKVEKQYQLLFRHSLNSEDKR